MAQPLSNSMLGMLPTVICKTKWVEVWRESSQLVRPVQEAGGRQDRRKLDLE